MYLFHYDACDIASNDDTHLAHRDSLQSDLELTDDFPQHCTKVLPAQADVYTASPKPARRAPGSSLDDSSSAQQSAYVAFSRQAKIIKEIWPTPTDEAHNQFPRFMDMYCRILRAFWLSII